LTNDEPLVDLSGRSNDCILANRTVSSHWDDDMLSGCWASEITSEDRACFERLGLLDYDVGRKVDWPVWTIDFPPKMILVAPVITALRDTLSVLKSIIQLDGLETSVLPVSVSGEELWSAGSHGDVR